MTAMPAMNGRSAAHAAKEEYDDLVTMLRTAEDDSKAKDALIIELSVKLESREVENTLLHQQVGFERARGDRYARYTQAMAAMLDPIIEACDAHAALVAGSFKKAKQMALEAAQDASREAVADLTPSEETRLTDLAARLAPEALPPNQLS